MPRATSLSFDFFLDFGRIVSLAHVGQTAHRRPNRLYHRERGERGSASPACRRIHGTSSKSTAILPKVQFQSARWHFEIMDARWFLLFSPVSDCRSYRVPMRFE